jgi:hypothetical protein
MFAQKHVENVLNAGRVERKHPVAGLAHYCLASKVIKLENQLSIIMFAHVGSPGRVLEFRVGK